MFGTHLVIFLNTKEKNHVYQRKKSILVTVLIVIQFCEVRNCWHLALIEKNNSPHTLIRICILWGMFRICDS